MSTIKHDNKTVISGCDSELTSTGAPGASASAPGELKPLPRVHKCFSVGDRVRSLGNDVGTCRYVGLLHGYSRTVVQGGDAGRDVRGDDDIWIGIEWDNRELGKHDGAVNGVRYFSCSRGISENVGASFVKVHKLQQPCTFAEAVLRRYTDKITEGETSQLNLGIIQKACCM